VERVSLYLVVDANKCTGHGRCYLSGAPDLLEQDEEGYVSIRGSRLLVPPDQVDDAYSAADACPEHAISVVEVEELGHE
jgi:ferredoxin